MKTIAKKIADESQEILKTAKEQIDPSGKPDSLLPVTEVQPGQISSPQPETTKKRELRLVQALEEELKDIRKERERKKLEEEKKRSPVEVLTPVETSSAKKGRRFSFGKKTQAKRQQTRVEKILPVSG